MEAYSVSGPAKNLLEFARCAARRQGGLPAVELTLATFLRGDSAGNALTSAARSAGVELEILRERRAGDFRVIPQLRAIVARRRPDLIQSHNVKSHFLVRWTGLHRRFPWIAFAHGYTAEDLKMRLYNQVDRWSLGAARRVVAVCSAFGRDLAARGIAAERITVRHNMVRPFVPPPASTVLDLRARLGIPDGARVIVSVGRLSPEKGHLDLVRAAARLGAGCPFRLVLAGEGPERPRIEREIARLGLADRVVLAGHQQNIAPFYAMADVLALPSHSEGSPNVLLEALAAGLPVVAAAVGGVPEIATDEQNALLVRARCPEALGDALARLLEDTALRERLAASARRASQQFSAEEYTRGLIQTYCEVLGTAHVTPCPKE
jgi:glycosyltransferase involved in cell wall biosynthesis